MISVLKVPLFKKDNTTKQSIIINDKKFNHWHFLMKKVCRTMPFRFMRAIAFANTLAKTVTYVFPFPAPVSSLKNV